MITSDRLRPPLLELGIVVGSHFRTSLHVRMLASWTHEIPVPSAKRISTATTHSFASQTDRTSHTKKMRLHLGSSKQLRLKGGREKACQRLERGSPTEYKQTLTLGALRAITAMVGPPTYPAPMQHTRTSHLGSEAPAAEEEEEEEGVVVEAMESSRAQKPVVPIGGNRRKNDPFHLENACIPREKANAKNGVILRSLDEANAVDRVRMSAIGQ